MHVRRKCHRTRDYQLSDVWVYRVCVRERGLKFIPHTPKTGNPFWGDYGHPQ